MEPLGHGGLALANSVAVSIEVMVLLWILRRRWGDIAGRELLRTLGQVTVAAGVMSLVVTGALIVGQNLHLGHFWLLSLSGGLGGLVYLGLGIWLKIEGLISLPQVLFGRRQP